MKEVKGKIFDSESGEFKPGTVYFDTTIRSVEYGDVDSDVYILPGLVDSHVHIESSMLTPLEYSKVALSHGVVAAVADPHEIANVCGVQGLEFMLSNAALTPMKIYFGVPSCVPATPFETSGAVIDAKQIDKLFRSGKFSHLSEMMNFPGVLENTPEVMAKIQVAKAHNLPIDGHAPMLLGDDLASYVHAGISTDHECTNVEEAIEKINLGMKIMLRRSSASNDFQNLMPLLDSHPNSCMLCTDDCHPEDLTGGYINKMVSTALNRGYMLKAVLNAASINAINHYGLHCGYLLQGQPADFIVVNHPSIMDVLATYIDGEKVWDGDKLCFSVESTEKVNQFYVNKIDNAQIEVAAIGKKLNVIEVIPDSLLTRLLQVDISNEQKIINSNVVTDVLKVIVLNRYVKAAPVVGFIKGFGLKTGAFGSTIAHDSHNLIVVGTSDDDILQTIDQLQKSGGGLAFSSGIVQKELCLPVAGLMTYRPAKEVAHEYLEMVNAVKEAGCNLKSPFMTLAFMALLVIPDLKIGDKGLFSVSKFDFIPLQQ